MRIPSFGCPVTDLVAIASPKPIVEVTGAFTLQQHGSRTQLLWLLYSTRTYRRPRILILYHQSVLYSIDGTL